MGRESVKSTLLSQKLSLEFWKQTLTFKADLLLFQNRIIFMTVLPRNARVVNYNDINLRDNFYRSIEILTTRLTITRFISKNNSENQLKILP